MNIYFVQAGRNGPIKIGSAINVQKRLESLQTGNHEELFLVHQFRTKSPKNALFIEKRIHRHLSKKLLRGEWFKLAKFIPLIKQTDGENYGHWLNYKAVMRFENHGEWWRKPSISEARLETMMRQLH